MEENMVAPTVSPAAEPVPVMQPEQPNNKTKWFAVAVIVVAVLALGSYVAYAAYYSPARVWQRFVVKNANFTEAKVATEAFSISYEDKGSASGEALKEPAMAMFNNLKFSFNGTAYGNSIDPANPEMSMDFQYSFGSGDTSISSTAKMVVKGQDVYFNLGSNPIINAMMSYLSPDKKVLWLKINTRDLQEAEASTSGKTAPVLDYQKYTKEYQDILIKYLPKIVLLDKFIDKQDVRGISTLHYSNTVDKVQVKAMLKEFAGKMIQQMIDQGTFQQDKVQVATNVVNKVVDDFVDRTKATTFETWIGTKDNQLHKIKYSVSAPSIASFISMATNQGSYLDQQTDPEKITDIVLKGISFDGVLTSEQEIYNIGKITPVTPPADFLDLAKKIKESKDRSTTTPESINRLPGNPLPNQ